MMVRFLIYILLIVSSVGTALQARGLTEFLGAVRTNNSELAAARKYSEYIKAGADVGLNPSDPEFGMGYFLGSPSGIGNQFEYEIVQAFEFPTAYSYKAERSSLIKELAEINYRKYERLVLIDAATAYSELIYLNNIISILAEKNENAGIIYENYKKKLEAGEATIFELNRARLSLLNASNKLAIAQTERESIIAGLELLSGGYKFDSSYSDFGDVAGFVPGIITDSLPVIQASKLAMQISETEKDIAGTGYLPGLSLGFHSEQIQGEKLQGVIFGLSLPLWENNNRGQEAEAAISFSKMEYEKTRLAESIRISKLVNRHKRLSRLINTTDSVIAEVNNIQLLTRAVEEGEITLTDYLMEMAQYYEALMHSFELRKDAFIIIQKLRVY